MTVSAFSLHSDHGLGLKNYNLYIHSLNRVLKTVQITVASSIQSMLHLHRLQSNNNKENQSKKMHFSILIDSNKPL